MASKRKQLLRAGVDVREDHVEFLHALADAHDKDIGDVLSMVIQIGTSVLYSHSENGFDPTKACKVTVQYADESGLKAVPLRS